MPVTLEQYN